MQHLESSQYRQHLAVFEESMGGNSMQERQAAGQGYQLARIVQPVVSVLFPAASVGGMDGNHGACGLGQSLQRPDMVGVAVGKEHLLKFLRVAADVLDVLIDFAAAAGETGVHQGKAFLFHEQVGVTPSYSWDLVDAGVNLQGKAIPPA